MFHFASKNPCLNENGNCFIAHERTSLLHNCFKRFVQSLLGKTSENLLILRFREKSDRP